MDKPTTPAEPNSTPLPDDSGSEQNFGATGVFGVIKAPDPVKKPEPGWGVAPDLPINRAPEAAKPQPVSPPAQQPNLVSEPVVHKVVFGGGAAENSPLLLDRMRMASTERTPVPAKAPAQPDPVAGGGASGGFTQLLRTLEMDLPSPEVAPAPQKRQESGLTGLLQTPGTPAPTPPPAVPIHRTSTAPPPIPVEPPKVSAPPAPGGFTQLLQTMPAAGSESGGSQTQAPAAEWEARSSPAPTANKPGSFTQLFSALDSSATSPAPEPLDRGTGTAPGSGPGSFTRMLSIEQQSAPAPTPFYEERKPAEGILDFRTTQPSPSPTSGRDPFAPAPLREAPPVQSAPPAGGAGITRLIRMLDEPSAQPPTPIEAAPINAPRSAEPGIWTQTFATLSEPQQPPAPPVAKAPEWAPPPPPVAATPAPSASPAGPSEFTRILDASRMREIAMRGGQPPVASVPPLTPAAPAPAPPAYPPMPSYQAPAPPSAAGMPSYGAPQPPAYPMNYPPQAGGMSAPAASIPQAPAMYAPAPPPIPTPPPPVPAPPAQPAASKLQQMVPILLIVTIVLLVALIVTVIFVMKH